MSSETHELKLKLPAEARAQAAALASELEKVEERAEGGAEKLRGIARELREAERSAQGFEKAIEEVAAGTLTLRPENAALLAQGYEQAKAKVSDFGAALAQAKAAQKATTSEADKLREGIRAATNEAKRLERDGARATAKALKDAAAEAKKLEDATAKGVKRGLEAAREEAERLSRGLEEAVGLQRRASGAGGGISLGLSAAGAAASLASSALHAVVDAAKEWIRTIPEGAAASERHQIALHALGAGYQEVQAATQGAVSAEQAYRLQQEIAQAGLSLTGRELATVTGRARDYARATGTDVQQAIDRLSEGLRSGSNEQLRRFGIVVEQGSTRTHTFRAALQQLAAQEGQTAHASLSVVEAQEQLSRAVTDLSQSFQAMVAEKIGLAEFFSQTASWIRDLAENTRTLGGELRNAAAAFGLLDSARAQHINQSASGEFTTQFSAAREELQRLGGDVSRIGAIGQFAVNATPAQRQQALDAIRAEIALRREGRSQGIDPATQRAGRGLFGNTNLQGVQDLSGSIRFGTSLSEQLANIFQQAGQDAETRRRDEAQRAEKAERERQQALTEQERRERAAQHRTDNTPDPHAIAEALRELVRQQGLAIRAGGDLGSAERPGARETDVSPQARLEQLRARATDTTQRAHENELQLLQRLTRATQEYDHALREQAQQMDRVRVKAEEAANFEAHRHANELRAAEVIRQHEQEALRQRIELVGARQQEFEANNALATSSRALTDSEQHSDAQRAERIRQLTTLRNAMLDLLKETDLRITQARAEGRSQAEINQILQERIGLQRSIAQVSQEQTSIQREQSAATRDFRDQMVGALSGTADAFASASVAALESGKSFADAMREMLRSVLSGLAKQSIVEALKNTALGVAALAMGNVASAPQFFAAAGLWGAVGIASGVGLAAMPRAPSTTAAPASSAGVRERPQLGASAGPPGPLQINVTVSGALMTSEQVQDGLVRGLEHAHQRGVVPRFLRPLSPSW